MKKFLKVFHIKEKGFTLIELLVVVAILGVLAGVVALNVGSFIGKGHNEAACTELHNVQTAMVAWMSQNSGKTPDLAAAQAAYMLGAPSGVYTVDGTGKVTQSSYKGGNACTSSPSS